MVSARTARILAAVLTVACAVCCFLPVPRGKPTAPPVYTVTYADGREEQADYVSLYPRIRGLSEDFGIRLDEGFISGSDALSALVSVVETGTFGSILSADFALPAAELTALEREYADTLFYADGLYALSGGLRKTARRRAGRLVYFGGALKAADLAAMGVYSLDLRGGGFNAAMLTGTKVAAMSAVAPYVYADGALYMDTAFGRRLIAGMPVVTELTLDMVYADDGALTPCPYLDRLTMPVPYGGMVASLFLAGENYAAPYFSYLKLTRGKIDDTALYGVRGRELDLCDIPEADVTAAFGDAFSVVHTKKYMEIDGYAVSVLPCGCYCYTRRDLCQGG